jgi:hypothetical protein
MPYDFVAIHVGRSEVEKNQIRPYRQNAPQRFFSVADSINRIACHGQCGTEGLADRRLAVNKKYSRTNRPRFQCAILDLLNCDTEHCRAFLDSSLLFLFRVPLSAHCYSLRTFPPVHVIGHRAYALKTIRNAQLPSKDVPARRASRDQMWSFNCDFSKRHAGDEKSRRFGAGRRDVGPLRPSTRRRAGRWRRSSDVETRRLPVLLTCKRFGPVRRWPW